MGTEVELRERGGGGGEREEERGVREKGEEEDGQKANPSSHTRPTMGMRIVSII